MVNPNYTEKLKRLRRNKMTNVLIANGNKIYDIWGVVTLTQESAARINKIFRFKAIMDKLGVMFHCKNIEDTVRTISNKYKDRVSLQNTEEDFKIEFVPLSMLTFIIYDSNNCINHYKEIQKMVNMLKVTNIINEILLYINDEGKFNKLCYRPYYPKYFYMEMKQTLEEYLNSAYLY